MTSGLKRSAGIAIKALNLGRQQENTATREFSSAVSRAQGKSYEETSTMTIEVPPQACVDLKQLKIAQTDRRNPGLDNILFNSYSIWAMDCEPEPEKAIDTKNDWMCKKGCHYDMTEGCVCGSK